MKFTADAAIDHVGQGSTIVHTHIILVIEALDLRPRHALCLSFVPHIHRVVNFWDGLGCVAHSERVHLRAQIDEIDDRIAFDLVLEVADFAGVWIGIYTFEVKKVAITYLDKVKGVSEVRARLNLFG